MPMYGEILGISPFGVKIENVWNHDLGVHHSFTPQNFRLEYENDGFQVRNLLLPEVHFRVPY